jgi:hypothetical protein
MIDSNVRHVIDSIINKIVAVHVGIKDSKQDAWFEILDRLFDYPQGFERFYQVLSTAQSDAQNGAYHLKSSVYDMFVQPHIISQKKELIPIHRILFSDELLKQKKKETESGSTPLEILKNWYRCHCAKVCHMPDSYCLHGLQVIHKFARGENDSVKDMSRFMHMLVVFSDLNMFHFSKMRPLSDLYKSMLVCLEIRKGLGITEFQYVSIDKLISQLKANFDKDPREALQMVESKLQEPLKHLMFCQDLRESVCIFEGKGSKSMFDLANSDWPITRWRDPDLEQHMWLVKFRRSPIFENL